MDPALRGIIYILIPIILITVLILIPSIKTHNMKIKNKYLFNKLSLFLVIILMIYLGIKILNILDKKTQFKYNN